MNREFVKQIHINLKSTHYEWDDKLKLLRSELNDELYKKIRSIIHIPLNNDLDNQLDYEILLLFLIKNNNSQLFVPKPKKQ